MLAKIGDLVRHRHDGAVGYVVPRPRRLGPRMRNDLTICWVHWFDIKHEQIELQKYIKVINESR